MSKILFIFGIILSYAIISVHTSFALPAGNTSDPTIPYGKGVAKMEASGLGPVKTSFDFDITFEKELKDEGSATESEIEGKNYLFRLGYTFADRFEPYVRIGVSHLETSWRERGQDVVCDSENGLAFGFGLKALVYEIPEHRIRFSFDGQYLYTDPDIENVTVDVPSRTVSTTEFEVKEWQIAGIVSMEFPLGSEGRYGKTNPAAVYSLIPYVGLAYFDSEVKTKFTYVYNYSINGTSNKDNFLLLTGCDIVSPEDVTLNVEGRFIGETAASGGCTVKF